MKLNQKLPVIFRSVVEALGFLWVSASIIFDVSGAFPDIDWGILQIIGFFVFTAAVISHLYSQGTRIQRLEQHIPRIEISKTAKTAHVKIHSKYPPLSAMYLGVRNTHEDDRANIAAIDVWARIYQFDRRGWPVAGPLRGQWFDEIVQKEIIPENQRIFRNSVTLPPNEREIYLLVAFEYGIDRESISLQPNIAGLVENALIKPGSVEGMGIYNGNSLFFIRVELLGENIATKIFWIKVKIEWWAHAGLGVSYTVSDTLRVAGESDLDPGAERRMTKELPEAFRNDKYLTLR